MFNVLIDNAARTGNLSNCTIDEFQSTKDVMIGEENDIACWVVYLSLININIIIIIYIFTIMYSKDAVKLIVSLETTFMTTVK